MGIFNFFKRKEKPNKIEIPNGNSAEIILWVLDYLPEHYSNERQVISCKDYLKNNEFGLALESLLELPNDTNHYFSDLMWDALSQASLKMNMQPQVKLCQAQKDRNKRDLKLPLIFGWTADVVADDLTNNYIAKKIKDEWDRKQKEKDGFDELIKKNGLHHRGSGRSGTLYIVLDGKVVEVYYEFTYEIEDLTDFDKWTYPTSEKMTESELNYVKAQVIKWYNK